MGHKFNRVLFEVHRKSGGLCDTPIHPLYGLMRIGVIVLVVDEITNHCEMRQCHETAYAMRKRTSVLIIPRSPITNQL